MKFSFKLLIIALISIGFVACRTYREDDNSSGRSNTNPDLKVSKSAFIPPDGSAPETGADPAESPSEVLTFSQVGQKYNVKLGETVNFIYDGVDPESTYIVYESTDDGYTLELKNRKDPVDVKFVKICQNFVVANPNLTDVDVPEDLRYEQIIWTPRSDGTWEVRIGTTERGCHSEALKQLQKLRTRDYEKGVPKK